MRSSLGTWKSLWRYRRHHRLGSSCFMTSQHHHVTFFATLVQGSDDDYVEQARAQQRENEAWAKRPGSREVLVQPPFGVDGGGMAFTKFGSLEDFLQARQWSHPEEGPARRFLSHVLTYPLTLAVGLNEAGLDFPTERDPSTASTVNDATSPSTDCNMAAAVAAAATAADKTADRHRIAVVCIGARAESTLPPALWRETLFALPGVSSLDLHLIGPELSLPAGVAPATQSGSKGQEGSMTTVIVGDRTADVSWTRAVLRRLTGACVGVKVEEAGEREGAGATAAAAIDAAGAIAERAMTRADAFILFNPGLGHPHLREGWEGALERLIVSGKPIIITCHSEIDLERDARRLGEVGERCYGERWTTGRGAGIFPRKNVFRSLMASEDPLSKPGAAELVSNNWGMLVVRGAQGSSAEDAGVDHGNDN